MASFLKKFKNLVLGKKDIEEITTSLDEFNKVTSTYIGVLQQQVDDKEKKVAKIRVLVNKMPANINKEVANIDIKMVDMHKTIVRKKGKGSQKQKMKWEDELKQFRKNNRGTLI